MKLIESIEAYEAFIQSEGLNVVIYSAEWCGDCRYLDMFIDTIVEEFKDTHAFAKVDTEKYPELAQRERIMGIPSFITWTKGSRQKELINKLTKTPEMVREYLS